MRCIAAIQVDLAHSPLGTASRLAEPLAGTPILRRTIDRLRQTKSVASIHLLVHVDQADKVREVVKGLPVEIETHQATPPQYAALVRPGRWWGLDSWRGGVGGLTVYDEDFDVELLRALAAQQKADAVLAIPAAAVLIDPALIDAMIQHHVENRAAARMTFVQAPPGLGGIILAADLLEELAPTGQPPGVLLSYHPDRPLADLTGKDACYRPDVAIIEASGRLLADTHGSLLRLKGLLESGAQNWGADKIAQWMSSHSHDLQSTPSEIEIELTTEDCLPETKMRPRGSAVPARGPVRLSVIQSVLDGLGDRDDVRIVLGGFGEPCLHPALPEICAALRKCQAIASIALRTSGILAAGREGLAESADETIFEAPVDVIEVMLDADTAETYQRVHGLDGFERAIATVERWIARRERRQQVRPLIVPSFTKSRLNLGDMESFFDRWQRRLGTALITGYSHCAGQRDDLAVTSVSPPVRTVCRRVFSRAVILADGRMTTCDQDLAGRQALGVVGHEPLEALWKSEPLASIRRDKISGLPLCPRCDEWHRP